MCENYCCSPGHISGLAVTDPMGIVFSYLLPAEQANLRAAASVFLNAFDCAVRAQLHIPLAGIVTPPSTHSNNTNDSTPGIPPDVTHHHEEAAVEEAEADEGDYDDEDDDETRYSYPPTVTTIEGISSVFTAADETTGTTTTASTEEVAHWFPLTLRSLVFAAPLDTLVVQLELVLPLATTSCTGTSSRQWETHIPNEFLMKCKAKAIIYLGGEHITSAGKFWMSQCRNLQQVCWHYTIRIPLPAATKDEETTSTGRSEGMQEERARGVVMSALPNLTAVGDGWMDQCHSLKALVLHSLPSLTTVGDYWLSDCTRLRKVSFPSRAGDEMPDTTGTPQEEDGHLAERPSSCLPVRSPLTALRTVGHYWLCKCSSLTDVSFQGLTGLKTVGVFWLGNCDNLEQVTISSSSPTSSRPERHGGGADEGEESGTRASTTSSSVPPSRQGEGAKGLVSLETVEGYWLSNCVRLETVTVRHLPSLRSVGTCWLSNCGRQLAVVRFEGLPALQSVHDGWLQFSGIAEVSFSGEEFPELRSVGSNWMRHCKKLTHCSFIGLRKLHTVGSDWLRDCESLCSVTFRDLSSLSTVGTCCLVRSPKLLPAAPCQVVMEGTHCPALAAAVLHVQEE